MLGVISAAQSPTANETTAAANALNLMLKAWQADGLQLWTVNQESVTPVQGREKYTMGTGGHIMTTVKPVEVFEAYRRDTSERVDVPLIRMSRTDYFTLSDKDTEGVPVNFYFELQQGDLNNFYVWPTADATFASDNTIEILWQKPFDDMDADGDDLAFPVEWQLAVVYGLAVLLAPEYGVSPTDQKLLREQAAIEKQRVIDWDTEHTSYYLTAEPRFSE